MLLFNTSYVSKPISIFVFVEFRDLVDCSLSLESDRGNLFTLTVPKIDKVYAFSCWRSASILDRYFFKVVRSIYLRYGIP